MLCRISSGGLAVRSPCGSSRDSKIRACLAVFACCSRAQLAQASWARLCFFRSFDLSNHRSCPPRMNQNRAMLSCSVALQTDKRG